MNEEEKKITGEIDISKTIESNIDYWRNKCFEQQKEIERLKQIEDWKNYRVYKNVEDYEIHDKFGKNNLLTKCIHKDKIKEKMRGEINKSWRNTEQRKCQLYAYDILKELLGE